jgi:hypothetical protein
MPSAFTPCLRGVYGVPFGTAGATYTVRASVKGDGGTASNGTVYLPNWD